MTKRQGGGNYQMGGNCSEKMNLSVGEIEGNNTVLKRTHYWQEEEGEKGLWHLLPVSAEYLKIVGVRTIIGSGRERLSVYQKKKKTVKGQGGGSAALEGGVL